MRVPQTVRQLNATIINSFHVLESSYAYESFPFFIAAGGQELRLEHRVPILSIALTGPVDLCCEQVWEALIETLTAEELADRYAILFVRQWFSYESDKTENILYGRIGFYDSRHQNALLAHRVHKGEGYAANKVIYAEE